MNEEHETKLVTMLQVLARDLRSNTARQKEIYEKLMDPENGITARVTRLENWKQNSSRVLWILITAIIGLGLSGSVWAALFK